MIGTTMTTVIRLFISPVTRGHASTITILHIHAHLIAESASVILYLLPRILMHILILLFLVRFIPIVIFLMCP